ncbi:PNK3P-domain-containing protein [Fomitopsis serialis]|uniref:PNK3P-domain-containing protein n=1 Tax=Fomitopsis serialis TaxID=139415 RepID=UPI00200853A5|nr:PNK3P-domain-containing protein [Neoantrodia serialis]KAH9925332.1 PNK3P-domain-containing protein [Neoantrodia serialis]
MLIIGDSISHTRVRARDAIDARTTATVSQQPSAMSSGETSVSIKPSGSKKRSIDKLGDAEGSERKKAPKLFPIFEKKPNEPNSTFQWIKPALGPQRTCLHGMNLNPESRLKVAAFDLDGCIIQSSFPKKTKGNAVPEFQWWRPNIPKKLKEVHDSGYSVVIITNQALKSGALESWKKKVPAIAAALSDVPFRILAAVARDGYRKPMPGMWYELERIFTSDGVVIDKSSSVFVGDAAGRQGDHASTDRKWALNVELPFYTPEEYFLNLPAAPYTLPGFHVSSLPADLPRITPTSTPLVPPQPKQELVIFVGYPSMGKSSFYRKHFQSADYVHVNQDTLRTRDKCVKAVQEAIQEGKSCVVDNTNRNAETRRHYVDLAKKFSVPIRCIVFNGSLELAWHNNLYRAFSLPPSAAEKEPKRELLPFNAFTSFRAQYEEPELGEGFAEVKKVNWVFEGHEEERKRWSMWLQIDGK